MSIPFSTARVNRQALYGTPLSSVTARPVRWLWPERIPLGKLTLLDGDPGLGKSALTADITARVTQGRPMPDGSPGVQGGVILMSAEDDLADTIRPRLDAAGADVAKVVSLTHLPDTTKAGKTRQRPLRLPDDIDSLEAAITHAGAVLVVIDPLMAFLTSRKNSWRDSEVREMLSPLVEMAERTGAALVAIRHLNKNDSAQALYRGGGSIAFIGTARAGLLLAAHPDAPEQRVLAMTKSNLGKLAPSLAFHLANTPAGVPSVAWDGACHYTAESLLAAATTAARLPKEQQDVLDILKQADEPLGPTSIQARLAQEGKRKTDGAVKMLLQRMQNNGSVQQVGRGQYVPTGAEGVTSPDDVTSLPSDDSPGHKVTKGNAGNDVTQSNAGNAPSSQEEVDTNNHSEPSEEAPQMARSDEAGQEQDEPTPSRPVAPDEEAGECDVHYVQPDAGGWECLRCGRTWLSYRAIPGRAEPWDADCNPVACHQPGEHYRHAWDSVGGQTVCQECSRSTPANDSEAQVGRQRHSSRSTPASQPVTKRGAAASGQVQAQATGRSTQASTDEPRITDFASLDMLADRLVKQASLEQGTYREKAEVLRLYVKTLRQATVWAMSRQQFEDVAKAYAQRKWADTQVPVPTEPDEKGGRKVDWQSKQLPVLNGQLLKQAATNDIARRLGYVTEEELVS